MQEEREMYGGKQGGGKSKEGVMNKREREKNYGERKAALIGFL